MDIKSGFVTIIGKANVGKSTLLNAIIGEKIAIVSPKPQTTRNKILGIFNQPDCQIVFTDTPGIHKSKNKLDDQMQADIVEALKGVDVVILVIDGSKRITLDDFEFVKKYDKCGVNAILVISKIDETKFEKLYPQLERFNNLEYIKDIIPVSAIKNKNISELINAVKKYLKVGVRYFDEDAITDKSVRFLIGEVIREKMLWKLNDEIPHGIAVEVVEYKEKKGVCFVSANVICEKDSHKQIIIGANGNKLKDIGISARIDIEKLVNKKVMLSLYVKVRADWRNNSTYIKDLGYKA